MAYEITISELRSWCTLGIALKHGVGEILVALFPLLRTVSQAVYLYLARIGLKST